MELVSYIWSLISFTPWPFYPGQKRSRCPLNRKRLIQSASLILPGIRKVGEGEETKLTSHLSLKPRCATCRDYCHVPIGLYRLLLAH